jgi:DNA-binding beta-propeller fold protein YncE
MRATGGLVGIVLAWLIVSGAEAPARLSLWGGLDAVAVSGDGKRIAVGGQNRVVYVLDAATLAVQKRIPIGGRVVGLAFSRDGARLLAADDGDTLHWLDPAAGKAVAKVEQSAGLALTPAGEIAAVRDLTFTLGTRIRFLATANGAEKGKLEIKDRLSAFTFSADGKQLIALTASREGDEKRVAPRDVPKNLEGLARREFIQRNDGRVSTLRRFEAPSGKLVRDTTLWYTSDSVSTRLIAAGELVYAVNFSNVCARITSTGAVTLFQTDLLFNHGLGASPDGKVLAAGGLAEGSLGPIEGTRRVKFSIKALPGRSEYFACFTVRPDGSAYGVTSSFRLVKISRDGKVEKLVSVY